MMIPDDINFNKIPNLSNEVLEKLNYVKPKNLNELSLNFLKNSKKFKPNIPTKSGMMVGLGETKQEIIQTMKDLRSIDCDLLTIGQYLRPSKKHHPIIKFYHPEEFEELREIAMNLGFSHVAAGPLVRSSYHADEQHNAAIDNLISKHSE